MVFLFGKGDVITEGVVTLRYTVVNKEKERISIKISLRNWLIPQLLAAGGAWAGLACYYFWDALMKQGILQ